MIVNRRDFMRVAGVGLAGLLADASGGQFALAGPAAPGAPLIKSVEAVCRRLSRHGWRELLLSVTGDELDLTAANLAGELAKRLTSVRRDVPGFEDFASEGWRAVEPGSPARSLLFHALASPAVTQGAPGQPLTDFPTLAELEAVENYVYGVRPPTLAELRARAGGAPLAVVVFAPEYRTVSHTVLRRHADMAFSRTACARVGNGAPLYDGRRRDFQLLDDADPFAFRAMPARFAPYIAMSVAGRPDSYAPMRFRPRDKDPGKRGDDRRRFWVPLHKVFSGTECVAGLDLDVRLAARFVNRKLQQFHRFMAANGVDTGAKEWDTAEAPFVLRDREIADFSARGEDGQGLVTPKAHPLFERATYRGKPLAFRVPEGYADGDAGASVWFSGMQILPGEGEALFYEAYMDGLNTHLGRPAPEYVNMRHELRDDGTVVDLNDDPRLLDRLVRGGYRALHFVDYTADGWVAAVCPQLARSIGRSVPAYSPVAPPDFFPAVMQRELMEWWEKDVPQKLRPGLWSIEPLALSDMRMAANVELRDDSKKGAARRGAPPPVFTIEDDTVTAIVGHPAKGDAARRPRPAAEPTPFTRLPDGSNGVFDPGWDVSQSRHERSKRSYLQNSGLGTPFIEDVKLCAALGSFWPAVVPDATRTFQPGKRPECNRLWPWPTNVPLTDEEIGIVEVGGGGFYPWDGVRGPQIVRRGAKEWVRYPNINHVDYTTLGGKMTALLTSRVDLKEYAARVLAMAAVYRALGVRYEDQLRGQTGDERERRAANRLQLAKSEWAVVSFRKPDGAHAADELRDAEQQAGAKLRAGETYRFHVYRHGQEVGDEQGPRHVLVEMLEQAILYTDGANVLRRVEGGKWERVSAA